MKLQDFTYRSYTELLGLLGREHSNVTFADRPLPTDPCQYCILRHDVDFVTGPALKMAELEASLGIRASYFLQLSSPFYNLLGREKCLFPRRLVELGHEVGLHYDTRVISAIGEHQPLEALRAQTDILSNLAGSRVKSIAMHNPSLSGHDPFKDVDGLINAYDSDYTTRIAYFSDSAGAWRDETVEAFESGHIPPKLQLLVHPIFWSEKPTDRWSKLNELYQRSTEELRDHSTQVREWWTRHPGVLEHHRRVESLEHPSRQTGSH